MNKSALKKYAPQAREDFIAAVTRRAETLGLNPKSPGTVEHDGDVMLINGQPFPADLERQRTTLQRRIAEQGFAQVMDAMAYTWFNRLVAIRYMELHGFLDHGYRVLGHPANQDTGHTQPEILDHIAELDLPGLDRSRALDLKLAGNRDEELYREVLLAQCHALHKAMPFLFESLDDATELLLPDGLLRTDSILGKLVTAIDEADWQDVEIIGWLYQFYISEKKDQVIGKVVKSEDIPAATQLFTPNWIVKYLVQNSLGRLWLMANPTSQLAAKWEYYIQPAEQTDEVNAQLDALIQARIDEDGATLNPESLTLLDPACGSGHILVEAYDLLRDIYLERGYRRQDIPRLILEKNLYGLDIDDRAAQLAGFALLMKARADDRRLFGQPVALNVLALQEAKEGSAAELHSALNAPQIDYATVRQLVETFEQAKTFGSLIQISDELANALPDLRRELETVRESGDMLGRDAAESLLSLVAQAEVLAKQFDAVVANPPYMGRVNMNPHVKKTMASLFPDSKVDLYSCFMERSWIQTKQSGFVAMVTMQGWMFLSSFENARVRLLKERSLTTMAHIGYNSFPSLNSKIAQATAFIYLNNNIFGNKCAFIDLNSAPQSADKNEVFLQRGNGIRFDISSNELAQVPGSPIAYWAAGKMVYQFSKKPLLKEFAAAKAGLSTTDNERFLRYWHEVASSNISLDSLSRQASVDGGKKWFPFIKGGDFRKWYGNREVVINWHGDGSEIKQAVVTRYGGGSYTKEIRSEDKYFKEVLAMSAITTGINTCRYYPAGSLPEANLLNIYDLDSRNQMAVLGFLNSSTAASYLDFLSPTIKLNAIDLDRLPFSIPVEFSEFRIKRMIEISRLDWDCYERSWDFIRHPMVPNEDSKSNSIEDAFAAYLQCCEQLTDELATLERTNNKAIIDHYELDSDVSPEVPASQITLTFNPPYRYGGGLGWENYRNRVKQDTSRELVSYAIGCMMGRYSLDAPGLIYAHAGNDGFDPSRYPTFPADDDGIVPITDEAWFDDDGANRIREFVSKVWGEETEAENIAWLAESLGSKASESADDTIRRYLSKDFYKDHLQTYKKRPIYWLFSSGKHKAFEALVYLHRYNAGTLSRMRMEYVVPLQSRMQARIDSLEQDITAATSSTEAKRLQRQRDKLTKQLDELRRYDETLRHYADQRITLDLDDGVKVNYRKFGDLLAEVKQVTGNK